MSINLQAIARAWMEKERHRVGIPKQEQDAAESETAVMLRRAQAAKAMQEMGMAPADQASIIDSRAAQAEYHRAAAGAKDTPPRGTPHYERDAQGRVTAITPQADGTFRQDPIGAVGTPQRDPREPPAPGRLSPVMDKNGNVIGTFHNVTGKVTPIAGTVPGEPVRLGGTKVRRSALPATMQQTAGMASTVQDNIAKMEELAGDVVTGPIAGRASQASQAVFGPHGPEGDFDFLGKAVIDTVYVKSGKQINENEMAILKQMIPTRARGNLPDQVRLFKEYANGLLRQYSVEDEAETPSDSNGLSSEEDALLNSLGKR